MWGPGPNKRAPRTDGWAADSAVEMTGHSLELLAHSSIHLFPPLVLYSSSGPPLCAGLQGGYKWAISLAELSIFWQEEGSRHVSGQKTQCSDHKGQKWPLRGSSVPTETQRIGRKQSGAARQGVQV